VDRHGRPFSDSADPGLNASHAATEKKLGVLLRLTEDRFKSCGTDLLVAQRQSGSETEFLYLFTTLSIPVEEILYRCRWYVETGLRSLKTTIRLHHVTAKSNAMMEKELFIAITAYNIMRAVMGWAVTGGLHRQMDRRWQGEGYC
jgi:hypothetical protein